MGAGPLAPPARGCGACLPCPPALSPWRRPDRGATRPPGAADAKVTYEATPVTGTGPSPAECDGHGVLRSILEIEARCLGTAAPQVQAMDDLSVEQMLDEPDSKYFLCSSLNSSVVIAYFWLRFSDVHLADVRRALVDAEERRQRDLDSEYRVHRDAVEGDVSVEEDISFVLRAPWPFADREVLQRRWQLPLLEASAPGLAIVMRSFEDESVMPRHQERVRAFVHKAAYLLRHWSPSGGVAIPGQAGLELVVCQQLDMGGLCPSWAQRFLIRFAVQRSVEWGARLRDHCLRRHEQRRPSSQDCQDPSLSCGAASQATARPDSDPLSSRGQMSGDAVLHDILRIESLCSKCSAADGVATGGTDDPATAGLSVECLLDERDVKYCLCGSLGSPIVTGFMRIVMHEVHPGDVWSALVKPEERLLRDPASEFQVLRGAAEGDHALEEDVCFVWRSPWPFWDREVLQRRWTYPVPDGSGLAIVMRSFEGNDLLPPREDRVRAFVHKCGYLLRPLSQGVKDFGLELTVVQQVDLGGLCPEWAQEVLTRWAVHRGVGWAEDLKQHCLRYHEACASQPSTTTTEEASEH